MLSGHLTARFAQCAGACLLVLLIGAGRLAAQEISLDLGGGVKMEFVWVPIPGCEKKASIQIGDFTGSHRMEPVKEITLKGPFTQDGQKFGYYLGKTEVTEDQWAAVMNAGKKSKIPVTEKSYAEILGFIEAIFPKVEQSVPKTPDGKPGNIRLPTEAEWEYAARGGASAMNYQANDPYQGDIARHEVISSQAGGRVRDVATFSANALGLHDMLGNVREFVEGLYLQESGGGRLVKGGCFTSEKSEIRSSARTEQSSKASFVGFRLCISADAFTSLSQTVLDKLKGTTGGESINEINLEEALKPGAKRKQSEADAESVKQERQKQLAAAAELEKMNQEEARTLDAKRKQFETDAESTKQERQKLTAAELEKKRRAAELAEKLAREEREKLADLRKSLEAAPPEPPPTKQEPPASTQETEGDSFARLVARAQSGDTDSIWMVAMAYFNGWPVEQNWREAAKWFAILAGNQNAKAILNLGIILWEQSSPIRDTQKAAQLFLEAAKRNEPEAVVFLSECVRYGFTGKDPDPKSAIRILLAAAQEKNLFAVDSLAWCLLEGSPELPQSEPKAVSLFREAWAAGHAPSAHALGFVYRNGRGVPKDMVRAREYYRLAAQGGYAPAQNTYARFLAAGTGGDKNEQEAIKWFSEAAKNGDKNAKSNLRERGISLL
jgi:TPR repeat protein